MSHGEEGMLVGTWDLVSLVSERPDGSTFEPFGPRPSGRTIYDVNGHVIGMIVGEQRNEATGIPSPLDVQSQFTAYFGTYRIDTQTGEVVHTVTTSLNGHRASGELRRHYKVENDISSYPSARYGMAAGDKPLGLAAYFGLDLDTWILTSCVTA